MRSLLAAVAAAALLIPLSSLSAPTESPAPVEVRPNEVVVEVNGIVCSFCAHGVEKSLSKLEGIDRSRYGNGVLVEIAKQRVTLAFAAGTRVDSDEIRQRIRKGGYEPVAVHVGAGL